MRVCALRLPQRRQGEVALHAELDAAVKFRCARKSVGALLVDCVMCLACMHARF